MMRNPLQRRMFMNPQQRRGMARMPQGILASGPRIMQAATQQEPVRMQDGGMFGFERYPGMEAVIGGQIGAPVPEPSLSPVDPAPGANTGSSSTVPPQNSPQGGPPVIGEEDNTDIVEPMPVDRRPDALPSDTVESRLPKDDKSEDNQSSSLMQLLDDLRNRRGGKDKDIKKYVTEANDLLKEFGIEAPNLKTRKDLRIMEFFLNMAAGQSPDFLTNVAQAGKESLKGYAGDVKEVEAAEQKLKLAGLEMGMAEKARAEATEQAILLKEYDITADAFEKINDLPDKSQQIKVLMETYNVPQDDAIKMVYPGRAVSPQGYEIRRDDLIARGHSPAFATYMSLGGASLMTQIGEGGLIVDSVIRAIGKDNMTQKDKDFLQPDQEPYRAGGG